MAAAEKRSSNEPRWLNPDEMQTWRALHGVLSVLPGVLSDQLRRDAGLSFPEYYVLACLSEQPDNALRMSRLAFLVGSELSRLSHLIGRLEKRGLVRREPDPTDGRFNLAIATPEGEALAIGAAPGHVETVRELIFDVLDEPEQYALRNVLSKLVDKLISIE